MSSQKFQLLCSASVAAIISVGPALAQTSVSHDKIDAMEAQINALQQELRAVKSKVNNAEKTAEKAYAAAPPAVKNPLPPPAPPSGVAKMSPGNRPSICTVDGQNCVGLTARLHFDVGGYDYRPNTGNSIQHVDDGVNARRARFGVLGTFMGDWNYGLVLDSGGTSDGHGGTIATDTGKIGLLPGGIISTIQSAFVSYQGIKGTVDVPRPAMPYKGAPPPAPVSSWGTALEVGYMDSFWSLDEATSSNDIMFLERASAQVIASNIAAGDFRSQAGARYWSDWLWLGAYATGPVTGAVHNGTGSSSAKQTPSATEQWGGYARGALHWTSNDKLVTVHVGGGAEALFKSIYDRVAGTHPLTFSDRPEIRIDPSFTILSTGGLTDVRHAQVYNVEGAASVGPVFFQGEYFWFNVDRFFNPSARFEGGYAQASWVITGESRTYNNPQAAFNGVVPKDPFSLKGGGWGAWEIAGRYSYMNLNDHLPNFSGAGGGALGGGQPGGKQQVTTVGLNWYVNRNMRFMLDYLHGKIDKTDTVKNPSDVGAKFDAVALRTQFAF
jgi:phosphate-selective porin OprO/OprP